MRRLIVKTGSMSIALVLAAISPSAMAQEGQAPAPTPAAGESRPAQCVPPPPPIFSLPAQVRAEWLAECRHRISRQGPYKPWHEHHESWRGHHRAAEDSARSRDVCESYLDDYYAYYASDYANYARYVQAGHAASRCCQQKPDCTESVEYEAAPLRPAARRIPRRTKTVPDKRIPLN